MGLCDRVWEFAEVAAGLRSAVGALGSSVPTGRSGAGDLRDDPVGPSLLEQLLGADTGHRGQRIDCGQGIARGSSVTATRTSIPCWINPVVCACYHCRTCGRGIALNLAILPEATPIVDL